MLKRIGGSVLDRIAHRLATRLTGRVEALEQRVSELESHRIELDQELPFARAAAESAGLRDQDLARRLDKLEQRNLEQRLSNDTATP